MAKGDEITTKFKVDISDLKKGIAEANQQIKLANAEFKAATAGMDDWSKSADGISAKLKQLEATLSSQKAKLEAYTEQLSRQEKAYNENGSRIEQLKQKLADLAANGVSKASDEYKKYENALESCQKGQEQNKKAVDDLKVTILNQQAAIGKTEAEMKKFGDSLNDAEKDAGELDQALDDLGQSAEQSGSGFNSMTVALGNMIADGIQRAVQAVKDFVAETVQVGMSFDQSMSQVGATSGATGEQLDQLRDKAKEMGESTKFSASESADAFNYMAMAGWKTEEMLQGIDGVLALAAAGNTDLATTSDIVTDALTAFGESADQAGRLADVMAAASSNANTNVTMMGETFKYVAPVAGTLGYSMEDVAVAIGLMANAGIKGGQAGTSLRASLTNLANPTQSMIDMMKSMGLATTEYSNAIDAEKLKAAQANFEKKTLSLEQAQIKYNAAVEKYGVNSTQAQTALINVEKATIDLQTAQEKLNKEQQGSIETQKTTNNLMTDSEGNMRSFSDVIKILREKFKELSTEEQAQAAATLFGKEAMSGMLAIINASDEDFEKLTQAINNSSGSAEEMAEVMQDNLAGDLTKLRSKLEGVQIELYEKFEPALRDGVEALSKMLDGVSGLIDKGAEFVAWLQGGSAEAETFKAVVIGVATAFGTLAAALAIHALIQKVQAAFVALNAIMMANPVALVVAAIAGLVAAFVTLWNKSEAFRNFWINLWEGIKNAVGPVVEAIVKWFSEAWENIKQAWASVKEWFGEKWEGIKSVFADVGGWFKEKFDGARNWVNQAFQDVGTWFGERRRDIETAWEPVDSWIKEKMDRGLEWTHQAWKDIGSWFGDRRKDIEDYLQTADKSIGEKFDSARDWVNKAFKDVGTWFGDRRKDIETAMEPVAKWMGDKFESAKKSIKEKFEPVVKWFGEVWEDIKHVFEPVGKWFQEKFELVRDAIKAPLNAVIRAMNTVIRGLNKIKIDIPDWVPGLGGKTFGMNIGEIPELAQGGVLKRGQVGFLEGKGAEAVVPLERNKAWIKAVATDLLEALSTGAKSTAISNLENNKQMNFTQNIYAPKQPSRIELYRQTKNLLAYASVGGVKTV